MQATRSRSWLAGIGSASRRRGIAIPRHASRYQFRKFVRRLTDTTTPRRPPPPWLRDRLRRRRKRSRHAPARLLQNLPSNTSPPCRRQRRMSRSPLRRPGMQPRPPRRIFSRPGHNRRLRRHLQLSRQPMRRGPQRTPLPGFPGSCARRTMPPRRRRSATGRPKARDRFASSDAAARCAGMSSIDRQATMARWC